MASVARVLSARLPLSFSAHTTFLLGSIRCAPYSKCWNCLPRALIGGIGGIIRYEGMEQQFRVSEQWGLRGHFTAPQVSFWLTKSSFFGVRFMCSGLKLYVRDGIVRFNVRDDSNTTASDKQNHIKQNKKKKSKKAKRNELRFFRLKARKKLKSSNPEVRIKYKLEKAKRKESWLVEKISKYETPKISAQMNDPEALTAEERFTLKRMGQKLKNYVPVGVRGVIGGVILNMHLHWKKHETVKVICKPCKPGQIHQYAEEISRLSGGIVIDIMKDNTIMFYRGKNYVRPEILSPKNTLSKKKALEKYKYEQSLEAVRHFISVLERELEDYHRHIAIYGKRGERSTQVREALTDVSAETNATHIP